MVMIESHDVNDADGYDASMMAASVTLDGRTDKHHFPPKDSHFRTDRNYMSCVFWLLAPYPTAFHKNGSFPIKTHSLKLNHHFCEGVMTAFISKESELELLKKQLGMELRTSS